MTKLATKSLFALCISLAFSACTVGDSAEGAVAFLDTDGDGATDAVDTDGDGIADYVYDCAEGECHSDLIPTAWCTDILVYSGGELIGLDWNCDGVIDTPLASSADEEEDDGGWDDDGWDDSGSSGTTTSTSNSTCNTLISIGGESTQITCTSDSGTYDCECRRNGELVSTCTTTSTGACSQPGGGNCCGF